MRAAPAAIPDAGTPSQLRLPFCRYARRSTFGATIDPRLEALLFPPRPRPSSGRCPIGPGCTASCAVPDLTLALLWRMPPDGSPSAATMALRRAGERRGDRTSRLWRHRLGPHTAPQLQSDADCPPGARGRPRLAAGQRCRDPAGTVAGIIARALALFFASSAEAITPSSHGPTWVRGHHILSAVARGPSLDGGGLGRNSPHPFPGTLAFQYQAAARPQ